MFGKKKNKVDLEELYKSQNSGGFNNGQVPPNQYPNDPYLNGYYDQGQVPPQQPPYQQPPYQQQPPYNPYPQGVPNQGGYAQGNDVEDYETEEPAPKPAKVKKTKAPKVKTEEDRYKSKLHRRYLVRAILILLNITLLTYFFYEIVILVRSYVDRERLKSQEYITLCGNSKKGSEEIYSKYELDGYRSAHDYGLVGSSLFLSENHVDSTDLSSYATLQLANVCLDTDQVAFVDNLRYDITNEDYNSGIDLFSLAMVEGDYLIYNRMASGSHPLTISDKSLDIKLYSIPDTNGMRREINIKNTPSNKATVISVKNTNVVPNDYYDIVIGTTKTDFSLPSNLDDYKIKVITESDKSKLLQEVYQVDSPYALIIGDELTKVKSPYDVLASLTSLNYTDDSKVASGRLAGYDQNDYIRELAGYIQQAGSCYKSDSDTCSVSPYVSDVHSGKKAYVSHYTTDDQLKTEVETILRAI